MFARNTIPYYFHTRRNSRPRRHHGKPENRRNIPSAFFGLVVTGLYAITMAEPNWFRLSGGVCSGKHLGLYTIFGMNVDHLKGICITEPVILKLRICASIALLGVISSMFQFALDVCGSNRSCLKFLRRNSIGNILSIFYAIVIMGFCYWITLDISKLTVKTQAGFVDVTCRFDIAFYLVLGAGLFALIATTLSLLQITCERRPNSNRQHHHGGSDMQLQLIDYNNGDDVGFEGMPPLAPPVYQP